MRSPGEQFTSGIPQLSRLSRVLLWFAGVDADLVRHTRSSRLFFEALGAGIIILSLFGGVVVAAAVADIAHVPFRQVWWVAILWAIVICTIDRLILLVSGEGWRSAIIAGIPRVAIALLLSATTADVVILKVYGGEIHNDLAARQTEQENTARGEVRSEFEPKLRSYKAEVSRLQVNERKVRARIDREVLRANEALLVEQGCGSRCIYYRGLVEGDRALLQSMRQRNVGRIQSLRQSRQQASAEMRTKLRARLDAIERGNGLLAQREALERLEARSAAVRTQALTIRLLFIALELSVFIAKLVSEIITPNSPYKIAVRGRRDQESLYGLGLSEDARTEGQRLADRGRATRRANRWAADSGQSDESVAYDTVNGRESQPVGGYSLDELAQSWRSWESRPVEIPRQVRQGGLFGVALLAAALIAAVVTSRSHLWLLVLPLLAAGGLLLHTRGFTRGTAHELRAVFATFVGGLVLPFAFLFIQ